MVIGEETFSKRKELLTGKLDKDSEETDDNNQCKGVSCCMDHRHGLREKKI